MSSMFFQPEKKRRKPIQNSRPNKFKGSFGRFRFENSNLLPECEDLQCGASARSEEDSDRSDES